MDKKKLLAIAAVVLVLILVVGGVVFTLKKPFSPPAPVSQEAKQEEPALVTWEDQAGFSFSYPETIEIDPHEEDTESYAHLELTSAGLPGNIFIWVKDTAYSAIEDWAEKEIGENEQVFDTELGGEPAKKVAFSDPKKLVTAAIDVDALVLVEMTPDEEGYWQEIYNGITSSFAFIPLESEKETASETQKETGGGSNIIIEAEEVIE